MVCHITQELDLKSVAMNGVMNPNLKVLVQIIVSLCKGQERGMTLIVYSHLKNTVEALSLFAPAFQSVVFFFLILLKLMDLVMNYE